MLGRATKTPLRNKTKNYTTPTICYGKTMFFFTSYLPEDDMFTVQPGEWRKCNKELGAVGVSTCGAARRREKKTTSQKKKKKNCLSARHGQQPKQLGTLYTVRYCRKISVCRLVARSTFLQIVFFPFSLLRHHHK